MTRRLHVLGHFHAYPPKHNAGAEWMSHAMLRYLHDEHDIECRVIIGRMPRRGDTFQRIPVETVRAPARASVFYRWADVAVTHLDMTRAAMNMAKQTSTPLVHLIHNDKQVEYHQLAHGPADLLVFNSEWLLKREQWPGPQTIVVPPVWLEDYYIGPIAGPPELPTVALLNLNEAKGSPLFYELARRMPAVRFLGIRGSYGTQLEPPDLPNLTVERNQPDIRKVYRRSSVVVMPSQYESWGRVAVEAGAAGRPSIAAPTPGLRETGVPWRLIPTDDVNAWQQALEQLLTDSGTWVTAARRAYEQARHLEALARCQMDELAVELRVLAGDLAARPVAPRRSRRSF